MHIRVWLKKAVHDEQGSIVVASLTMTFVMTLLGVALFQLSTVESRMVLDAQCNTRAYYAAEAGLQRAFLDLGNGASNGTLDFDTVYNNAKGTTITLNGYTNASFSHGTYTVKAKSLSANPNLVNIISTGSVAASSGGCPPGDASASVTLQASVKKGGSAAGLPPVFGLKKIILNSGMVVDSFDSSVGPYSVSKCRRMGCGDLLWTNGEDESGVPTGGVVDDIGTDSTIYGNVYVARGQAKFHNTNPGAGIWGDFHYDPADASVSPTPTSGCGSDVTQACQVRGSVITEPLGPKLLTPVPDCTTQAALPDGTPFPAGSRDALGYSTQAYVLNNMSGVKATDYPNGGTAGYLNTNNNITVTRGTAFCFSAVSVSASITIPSTGSGGVGIDVNGQQTLSGGLPVGLVDLSGANIVNDSLRSAYFQIYSSSTADKDGVKVASGAKAYLYILAPRTEVKVSGTSNLYGAVFGGNLAFTGSANMHFDRDLLNVSGLPGLGGGGGSATYVLISLRRCANESCT